MITILFSLVLEIIEAIVNNIWYRTILFGLLLMLVLAPFAGFAPLLLVLLIAGAYWFFSSILQVLIFGNSDTVEGDSDITGS